MCCCGALGRFVLFFSLSASLGLITASLLVTRETTTLMIKEEMMKVPVWRKLELASLVEEVATGGGAAGALALLCGVPNGTALADVHASATACAARFDVWDRKQRRERRRIRDGRWEGEEEAAAAAGTYRDVRVMLVQ